MPTTYFVELLKAAMLLKGLPEKLLELPYRALRQELRKESIFLSEMLTDLPIYLIKDKIEFKVQGLDNRRFVND